MRFRGLCWTVCVVIIGLTVFSGGVVGDPFVDIDPGDLEGNGTEASPYEIGNASQLQAMSGNLSANYTLVGDIDASNTSAWNGGDGFAPVGNDTDPFTGTFDGNGYAVTELTINRSETDGVGLFGVTEGTVQQVGLREATITGGNMTGGLIGENRNGIVENSSVTGTITATNASALGGAIGLNTGESAVSGVFSSATVEGTNTTDIGGLVGNNTADASVQRAVANGSVDGTSNVGGLVGNNTAEIQESFATGTVNGSGTGVENVGGLVGFNSDSVTDSYWDTEETNQSSSDGGTGLTTAQMTGNNATVAGNMDGFGFYENWIPTASYPELAWRFVAESTGDGSEADPLLSLTSTPCRQLLRT